MTTQPTARVNTRLKILTRQILLGALTVLAASGARANETKDAAAASTKDDVETNAQLYARINSGWTARFDKLKKVLAPEKDYITWIIEMPIDGMDMRTPELFRRSVLPVYNLTHSKTDDSISHMMIAWQCHDESGRVIHGATGQTGEDSSQSRDMILGGWGQSTFFAVYSDGSLNDPEDVADTLKEAYGKNLPLGHVTFEVARDQCQNMLKFLKTYIWHPHKPMTQFGMNLHPLKFEGGGCGSFANAMLTHAGILPSVQPLLWRNLRASTDVMGYGLELPVDTVVPLPKSFAGRENYVYLTNFQLTPWTLEDGPALNLVDPEIGFIALKTIAQSYFAGRHQAMPPEFAASYGLRTIRSSNNRPNEDVIYKVDASFDPQMNQVARRTMTEVHALEAQQMSIRPTKLGKYPGFMISR